AGYGDALPHRLWLNRGTRSSVRDYHEAKTAALDGRSAPPGWPAAVSGRLLFIVFATGARQRRALRAWIDGARPPDADQPEAVQAGKPDRLAAALEAAPGDLLVVPLGVARLTKGIPRAPWLALQPRLRRRGAAAGINPLGGTRPLTGPPPRRERAPRR